MPSRQPTTPPRRTRRSSLYAAPVHRLAAALSSSRFACLAAVTGLLLSVAVAAGW